MNQQTTDQKLDEILKQLQEQKDYREHLRIVSQMGGANGAALKKAHGLPQ